MDPPADPVRWTDPEAVAACVEAHRRHFNSAERAAVRGMLSRTLQKLQRLGGD
ncbi:MAG: hypothetical protein ACKONH_00900 [Planctomycetia bacterium]